jgi:hypothetical protein
MEIFNHLKTDWLMAVKLPLVLASTVILGSESHGTHDHILLSRTIEKGFIRFDIGKFY